MFKRQIGHASINYAKLNLKFWHGVVHVPIDTLTACASFFFFLEIIWPIQKSEKSKSDQS